MNENLTLFLKEETISARVGEMADRLNKDFDGKAPVFVSVLSGALIFTSDLIRHLKFDHTLTFTKISSYKGTTSTDNFNFRLGLEDIPENSELIILEDIVDTGKTLNFLLEKLRDKNPKSVSVATLLLKPDVYRYHHKINYVGFEVADEFVVGYGMDLDHKFRNLRDIYIYNQII